jgi:hypothetical protein
MTSSTFSPDRQAFRATLATLAEKTKTKIPELNGRVEKALRLALAGDVELHDNGSATVYSSSDPTRRYAIIEGTCTCRDYEQAPQHLCQHRLSAGLVRRTHELLPQPAPGPHNDAQPAPALPEAPASANCHILIEGRQVQLTLRDTDEGRLLQRLAAVLAQYPLPAPQAPSPQRPAPGQPQGQGQGWCKVHNVQMTQNQKQGRSWWSHRLPEGGFCKGR